MITDFRKVIRSFHEEASINACRMEHIITEKMLEAIEEYIK